MKIFKNSSRLYAPWILGSLPFFTSDESLDLEDLEKLQNANKLKQTPSKELKSTSFLSYINKFKMTCHFPKSFSCQGIFSLSALFLKRRQCILRVNTIVQFSLVNWYCFFRTKRSFSSATQRTTDTWRLTSSFGIFYTETLHIFSLF